MDNSRNWMVMGDTRREKWITVGTGWLWAIRGERNG